jgi:hypothetical protein
MPKLIAKRIKKKNFSSFTYAEAFKHLHLKDLQAWHFDVQPLEPSAFFNEHLQRITEIFDLQSFEESKKLVIDAIAQEAIHDCKHLKIWKGAPLSDDSTSGYADYLIAERKAYLEAPFLCVVEAKKDDFEQGLAQCLVEMKACQYNNQRLNQLLDIFGIVTNRWTGIWNRNLFQRKHSRPFGTATLYFSDLRSKSFKGFGLDRYRLPLKTF